MLQESAVGLLCYVHSILNDSHPIAYKLDLAGVLYRLTHSVTDFLPPFKIFVQFVKGTLFRVDHHSPCKTLSRHPAAHD